MENPTHAFKEIKLVLWLILESQTYSKTVMMSWSSRKKKKSAFFLFSSEGNFFNVCFYLNV